MGMRRSIVLLKYPIISKHFVFIFQSDGQYMFDVLWLIWSCIQNGQRRNTFCENFRFCFLPPALSASDRSTAHTWSFCELYTPSMSNIFSSENNIFIVVSCLKHVLIQIENLFLWTLCSSLSNGTIRTLYAWYFRSCFSIRWTLVREILNSRANIRKGTFFLRLKQFFTFWIICFVRTIRVGPGEADSWIAPVFSIVLYHILSVS